MIRGLVPRLVRRVQIGWQRMDGMFVPRELELERGVLHVQVTGDQENKQAEVDALRDIRARVG